MLQSAHTHTYTQTHSFLLESCPLCTLTLPLVGHYFDSVAQTHCESKENGKCLRLDSIRPFYRVHLFLSHRVLKQFEGRHKRDANVNGLKEVEDDAAAALLPASPNR